MVLVLPGDTEVLKSLIAEVLARNLGLELEHVLLGWATVLESCDHVLKLGSVFW